MHACMHLFVCVCLFVCLRHEQQHQQQQQQHQQPLLEQGIALCLQALRSSPRLLVAVRGSQVYTPIKNNKGLGFTNIFALGDLEGFVAVDEPERMKQTLLEQGFYFQSQQIF